MKLEYHPHTVDDLNNAEIHYNELQLGLSQAFRIEVLKTIQRIKERPYLYAETNGVRRALLKSFPFSVVYRILDDETIRVLLVRHHKRHPGFGSERR